MAPPALGRGTEILSSNAGFGLGLKASSLNVFNVFRSCCFTIV